MTTELKVFDKEEDNKTGDIQEIDQIRKLLFGEFENKYKERLKNLERRIERLEANQKTSMVKLSESIMDLGHQVSKMSQDLGQVTSDDNQSE